MSDMNLLVALTDEEMEAVCGGFAVRGVLMTSRIWAGPAYATPIQLPTFS